MRVVTLLALAATSCAAPSGRCDLSVSRDLSFSSAEAQETIMVRSFGPACDKAIGYLEIRAEDGRPIWAWASPLSHNFGDVFAAENKSAMQAFLDRWAQPRIGATRSAPDWAELQPGQTTLDRLTYDDIRARNLPMLCHASGTGQETCVFFEPASGGAGHFLDREMEES